MVAHPIIMVGEKQFKTEAYEGLAPLGCCLYHKEKLPRQQNFLDMLRFTFLPYFEVYSFTFFWLATIAFVYVVSLYMDHSNSQEEFLRVSQKSLFELGENYPYYIVRKFHYYRLITSIVLIRNLYHFIVAAIGILIFASYIEALEGFKRIFLLSVTSGVGGEMIRNAFVFNASIESLTPICGLVGYLLGLYLANRDSRWRYCDNEKVHMLLIILLVSLTYLQLGVNYGNISLLSMAAGLAIGFSFFFCDPDSERFSKFRIPALIFLFSTVGLSTVYVLLRTQPELLEIR